MKISTILMIFGLAAVISGCGFGGPSESVVKAQFEKALRANSLLVLSVPELPPIKTEITALQWGTPKEIDGTKYFPVKFHASVTADLTAAQEGRITEEALAKRRRGDRYYFGVGLRAEVNAELFLYQDAYSAWQVSSGCTLTTVSEDMRF